MTAIDDNKLSISKDGDFIILSIDGHSTRIHKDDITGITDMLLATQKMCANYHYNVKNEATEGNCCSRCEYYNPGAIILENGIRHSHICYKGVGNQSQLTEEILMDTNRPCFVQRSIRGERY